MKTKSKFTIVYARVSSMNQNTRSQRKDLERYVESNDALSNVKWVVEKHTGKTMDRPKWLKIENAIVHNRVSHLIVWRLDRLGRTASGLTKLFETLQQHKCNLISLKDGMDLSTTAGRLVANVMASVAAFETELRAERVRAGQAAAKAAGKRWGGSKKGMLRNHTKEQLKLVCRLKSRGENIATIARATELSRPTIYRILKNQKGA